MIGLLITGSGKFFSNGIDLAWRSKQSRDSDQEYLSSLDALTERIMIFPVPTVALINGKPKNIIHLHKCDVIWEHPAYGGANTVLLDQSIPYK